MARPALIVDQGQLAWNQSLRTKPTVTSGSATLQVSSFPQKAIWLFRFLGFFRALAVILAKPFAMVTKLFSKSEWYWWFTEKQFDLRYGVDTVEIVPLQALSMSDEQREQAVFYEPTPMMEFGYVIARLGIDPADYTFLDLGSGKGRVLMMANWFEFRKILGVEICPELTAIARKNVATFSSAMPVDNRIEVVCENASQVELPETPLVIFMFNPFHEQVIQAFLDSLRESLLNNPRPVLIVYSNPKHDKVFEDTDWLSLERRELGGWYSIYCAGN